MKIITLEELEKLGQQARESIWEQSKRVGREPKIYLHWTAGGYNTTFSDYHINITGNGTIYIDGNLDDLKSHTWKRNTGAIGVTLCCAYGATTKALGMYKPTAIQIEQISKVSMVLADALWLTIDKKHIMTHGEAGDNEDGLLLHEDYGCKTTCERWDLEVLGIDYPAHDRCSQFDPWGKIIDQHRGGDVIRGKANWYRMQKKKGFKIY